MKGTIVTILLLALTATIHAQDFALERKASQLQTTMATQLSGLHQELLGLKTNPPYSTNVVPETQRLINAIGITLQRYEAEMEALISASNNSTEKDNLHIVQQVNLQEASHIMITAKSLAERKREEAYRWIRNPTNPQAPPFVIPY